MQPANHKKIIGRLIAFFISIAALAWVALSFDLEGLWLALKEANYWLLIPVSAQLQFNNLLLIHPRQIHMLRIQKYLRNP